MEAITWERVTHREVQESLMLIQQSFPVSNDYLPEELADFWEHRKSLFVVDNGVLMQDRVVIPLSHRKVVLV